MLVLALDTTTRQGSAALVRDGGLIGTYTGDSSLTHGERLPGDLIRLLATHELRLPDVDLFAVAAGPGSFTGLRIGIATLQGLALANNRPLTGVSALDAWNHAAQSAQRTKPSTIAVWMDAQRGEVFSTLYAGENAIEGPTVEKPAVILERWASRDAPGMFVGDGAVAYEELIRAAFSRANVGEDLPPLAVSVAHLGEALMRQHGPAMPDAIRPIYVRRSDAELARDRAVRLHSS